MSEPSYVDPELEPGFRLTHVRIRSLALTTLTVIVIGYLTHVARGIVVPFLFAVFFNLLFSPVVEWLHRRHIPRFLSALLLVLALPAAVTWTFITLSEPVSQWMAEAPLVVRDVRNKLLPVQEQIAEVQKAADAVDELTQLPKADQLEVQIRETGMFEKLVQSLPSAIGSLALMTFTAFFLLTSGRAFMHKLASLGRSFGERRRVVRSILAVQRDVRRFLMTVVLINVGLGLATGLWVSLIGGDDAVLWAVAAAVANFAPYLGALAVAAALGIAGLITFPTVGGALALVGGYLSLTAIEGQLVTPSILGRNLAMSPVLVFLSVVVGAWLWGIPGALIAVPCLLAVKAICEELPQLRPVALLLRR